MTPEDQQPESVRPGNISQISTSWPRLHDPEHFVRTYGPAMRKYLLALLQNEHEAEDVLQDLFVQATQKGFAQANPERGRFRDYLRTIVRNAARQRLRRKPLAPAGEQMLEQLPEDGPRGCGSGLAG